MKKFFFHALLCSFMALVVGCSSSPPKEVENVSKIVYSILHNDPEISDLKMKWVVEHLDMDLYFKRVNYDVSKKFICFAFEVVPRKQKKSSTGKIVNALGRFSGQVSLIKMVEKLQEKSREKTGWNVFIHNTPEGCKDEYLDR